MGAFLKGGVGYLLFGEWVCSSLYFCSADMQAINRMGRWWNFFHGCRLGLVRDTTNILGSRGMSIGYGYGTDSILY